MNRLKNHSEEIIQSDLLMKDHFINVMQIPYLNKIVLNIGLGQKIVSNKKEIVPALLALELIGSQKAIPTIAKKSIDKFKLKKKMVIGSKITLRKRNMFFFLDRLTNQVLPNLDDLEEFYKNYNKKNSQRKEEKILNSNDAKFVENLTKKKLQSWDNSFGLENFFIFKEIPYDKFQNCQKHGLNLSFSIKQGFNYSSSSNLIRRSKGKTVLKHDSEKSRVFSIKDFYKEKEKKSEHSFIHFTKKDNKPYDYMLSSFQIPL